MLSRNDILEIVTDELQGSEGAVASTESSNYEDALSLYLGEPDGREIEGRSSVTSTDVADAIEWIMPQVMKSFTQNNEVVVFDPVHDGDERQAELESEYVYEVLMKQNDGFIILHQFVKDALMQRIGALKVYYAERSKTKVSEWTGITEEQMQMLLMAEGVELLQQSEYVDQQRTVEKQQIIEQQIQQITQQLQQNPNLSQNPQVQQQLMQLQADYEKPVTLYDIRVGVERVKGQIYVDPVPPEELRVNSRHNSICLDKARFSAHVTQRPAWELIEDYDITLEETEDFKEGRQTYESEYRFRMQNNSVFYDQTHNTIDKSNRDIDVAECYLRMDITETGKSGLFKVTTAGDVENPTDLLSVEEIEFSPWVTTTAVLMSHKFQGLSITDRLKQIQEQKTQLWRNMFDNMYLQNNQRNVVLEGQVNMDDLLVSRPGGIIRAKRLDAIAPLTTPQLGQDAYNMMEYLDRVRAGRTGVDPDGTATPQNIGDRVGSEGVDRILNAKEELVGLIVRVIAETGIKPLCTKIRDLSIHHINAVIDFRFRGQWQQINPAMWCDRTSTTVRVGTGSGNHIAQRAAIATVLEIQKTLAENPKSAVLIDEKRTFNALDDFCKFSGLNGANRYFMDPESNEGKQKLQIANQQNMTQSQKEEQLQMEMVNIQKQLATAETEKANAQRMNVAAKSQADQMKSQLQFQKQSYEARIAHLTQQLDEMSEVNKAMSDEADRLLKEYEIDTKAAIELTRIEAAAKQQQDDNYQQNQGTVK